MPLKSYFQDSSALQNLDLIQIVQLQQEIATSTLNVADLKKMVCMKAQDLTKASGAVVEMAEGDEMVYRAITGTLEPYLGVRIKIATSLSGRCVQTGQVLHCKDSETDPTVDREACRRVGARSLICVPLQYRNIAVGVLKVVSPNPNAFTEKDVGLLRLIAGLMSAAIALRESEAKALESNRIKSSFLANMSHEIRTPMNGVMGMTSLLMSTPLNTQQREYVQIINSSAQVLLELLNDLLDISKIEARQMKIEKIDFDLPLVIHEVKQLLQTEAEKKGLQLLVETSSDIPMFVQGDSVRLRQVLANLLNNAIKFTLSGSVKLKVVQKSNAANAALTYFEVTDTGIGISKDAQAQLFKPFTQAESSTTRRFGGTGLGLSICKELVEMMGGTIGLDSEEGKGSTFWFTLPLISKEAPKVKKESPMVSSPTRKLSVLVAEDNPTNQLVTSHMLKKLGHDCVIVANGQEVMDALQKHEFDLILMDCHMPKMDGFQATRIIRQASAKWSQIPIIAMTASAMEEDRKICLQAGMTGYLTKPATFQEIAKTLESVLVNSLRHSA